MRISLIVALLCALLVASCSSTVAPHSHLRVGKPEQHIWSYLEVIEKTSGGQTTAINDYHYGVILDGETFVLKGGIKVVYQNGELQINGTKVPKKTLNLVVQADGTVKLNYFIRTFK